MVLFFYNRVTILNQRKYFPYDKNTLSVKSKIFGVLNPTEYVIDVSSMLFHCEPHWVVGIEHPRLRTNSSSGLNILIFSNQDYL